MAPAASPRRDSTESWEPDHPASSQVDLAPAFGSLGGLCVGSREVVAHQRLSGAGYCFSAAAPPFYSAAALAALAVVDGKTGVDRLAALRANAKGLRAGLREAFGASSTSSLVVVGPASPDVPFALLALRRSSSSSDDDAAGDLAALDRVADAALAKGYVVAVVVHPNAGGGAAFPALRAKPLALRVCVTAAHDENDVSGLVRALAAAADAV